MKLIKTLYVPIFLSLFLLVVNNFKVKGAIPEVLTENIEGKVINILENKENTYQKLEIEVTKGSIKGEKIIVENIGLPESIKHYDKGDRLLISYQYDMNSSNKKYLIKGSVQSQINLYYVVFLLLLIVIVVLLLMIKLKNKTR